MRLFHVYLIGTAIFATTAVHSQQLRTAGKPAELTVRPAGAHSIRITLKPAGTARLPFTPALVEQPALAPVITLKELHGVVKKQVGSLLVTIQSSPLTVKVTDAKGQPVQELIFREDGQVQFKLDDHPILGMGEGGPKPGKGVNWRQLPVEFDRRGRLHQMQPRWQGDAYGSRNPVPLLVGTGGWGLFVASPWVLVDLQQRDHGIFIPWQSTGQQGDVQNQGNQHLNQGKGLPPAAAIVPGLFDCFVFDAHDPAWMMKDVATISGAAVMPPKWALGYMQSHRTLEDETQLIGIIDTFRAKQIPLDAVIYLGTGFAPRGWNTKQPSFDFNPEVFKRAPAAVISDMHQRHVKVVVHIVPWDRDRLPGLQGSIPPAPGETRDASHINSYWQQHVGLMNAGIDGFWPDEGDWFNLFERMKRHQLYYQGPLATRANTRPWSLHRNGFLGIARWGGWIWSGDTQSSWKTLETQIAVGVNSSLSLSPYWGSDIGGFYPSEELTGEMYARWFQFGAFCPSFRSHGRTWWTRLPWGWGLSSMGPLEDKNNPLSTELNNPAIEPVVKQYDELHYSLLPYTYTLAWEARNTGMPFIRAMWLHYPADTTAARMGNQYLWGRDLLIAPVYEPHATSRTVYLPEGDWYDWWTNAKETGGRTISRKVDLSIMPIYVRAGAIIPVDPVRQYNSQAVNSPTTLKVYRGANGQYTLYEDDGISQDYLQGKATLTRFAWDDASKKLTIVPLGNGSAEKRVFNVQLLPEGTIRQLTYTGRPVSISF
ncbi:MAG TPA: TIM-barrel domain-containing protein, partial [Chitinophaga sp.]